MRGKWTGVVLPVVLGIAVLVGFFAIRLSIDRNPDDAGEPAVEPAHDVAYEVSSNGIGDEAVDVGYTNAEGGTTDANLLGPVWTQRIRTKPGAFAVALSATNDSINREAYRLTCRISVDGVQVVESTSFLACSDQFSFSRLHEPTPAPAAAVPPACRYVTASELKSIVSAAGASRKVLKPTGDETSCRLTLDGDAGTVSFEIEPDGKRGGPPAERVPGLIERAYFSGDGESGELRVSLPGGDVFVLAVDLRGLDADPERIAVEAYREARPRLLDER